MARVEYETVKKPIDRRLEDAACIYWDVAPEFFRLKSKDMTATDRRRTLYLLLREDAQLGDAAIAERYGHAQSTIQEGLELFSFQMRNTRRISDDMKQIRAIAANLDAKLLVVNVELRQVVHELVEKTG